MDLESYQVTEASSDALREIYDGLSALPTMILSDMIMPSTRRNKEDDEIILIPERSAQYIYSKGSNLLSQQLHLYTVIMRW